MIELFITVQIILIGRKWFVPIRYKLLKGKSKVEQALEYFHMIHQWPRRKSTGQKGKKKGPGRSFEWGGYSCNFLVSATTWNAKQCVSSNKIDPSYTVPMMLFDAPVQHYSTPPWPLPFRLDKISWKGRVFLSLSWGGFDKKAWCVQLQRKFSWSSWGL